MNLTSAFKLAVDAHSTKTVVYCGDVEYSFQALYDQSLSIAERLIRDFSVKPGDHIGIWLRNCPEFIPALFGILHAGAAAVPINHFLKPAEVGFIVADAGINVVITQSEFATAAQATSAHVPALANRQFIHVEDWAKTPLVEPRITAPEVLETDLALIIYTSGTTGKPKGAMLTHGNLLHNVNSCKQVLGAIDQDRFALMLPMFHSFMLCVSVFLPLLVGAAIVLVKSLHPARSALQEIIRCQATILPAIPQFFRTLTEFHFPAETKLRLFISGAAPLPVKVLRDFIHRHKFPILEGYGLSEASPVVALNPIHGPWKEGSIGPSIPDVQVTIQDETGRILPPAEIGELCVRGGNVMRGYWNQPQATAGAFRNGWLLTGDVGRMDAEGYIYITDRKKDMLLINGNNVYPREIEETLLHFPGVAEVAVVGQPDPRKGEKPAAFVVAREGAILTEKALVHYARKNLANYKVPRRFYFLPALPRNATGKVLKTELRRLWHG
jgi:long-chain acyl-CoA synthetase